MVAELLLRERLTDRDLALLAQVAGGPDGGGRAGVRPREAPGELERLLALPQLFEALFRQSDEDPLVLVSPFMAFVTLLSRAPVLLEGLAFVPERVGSRRSVPVSSTSSPTPTCSGIASAGSPWGPREAGARRRPGGQRATEHRLASGAPIA